MVGKTLEGECASVGRKGPIRNVEAILKQTVNFLQFYFRSGFMF